jgi:hypothetical protein
MSSIRQFNHLWCQHGVRLVNPVYVLTQCPVTSCWNSYGMDRQALQLALQSRSCMELEKGIMYSPRQLYGVVLY